MKNLMKLTSGMTEEVLALAIVKAVGQISEALVGVGSLPGAEITPGVLTKVQHHLAQRIQKLEPSKEKNRKLIAVYESVMSLT